MAEIMRTAPTHNFYNNKKLRKRDKLIIILKQNMIQNEISILPSSLAQ